MNPRRFYLCVHCKTEHGNPASAAICCLKANERWYCSECSAIHLTQDLADKCCAKAQVKQVGQ